MTTKEVADKLVKMCPEGKVEEVKQELFPEDTLSRACSTTAKSSYI